MTSLGISPDMDGMDGTEFVIGVTDTLTVRAGQIRAEVRVYYLLQIILVHLYIIQRLKYSVV